MSTIKKKSPAKKSTKTGVKKAAAKKSPAKKSTKRPSLVDNINKRKRAGTSRTKANSTVSKKSYENMKQGWPKK